MKMQSEKETTTLEKHTIVPSNRNNGTKNGSIVMVTGGAGFLGQHIVKLLDEKADDVKEIRVFDKNLFVNKLGMLPCYSDVSNLVSVM